MLYLPQIVGGLLIGLSALLMLALLGRITGISGIAGNLLITANGRAWRGAFVIGLIAGPVLYHSLTDNPAPAASDAGWLLTVIAGLLVGFGTRYASGCTSGHGVCGLARLSARSLAAVAVFMGSGMVTVFVVRHLL